MTDLLRATNQLLRRSVDFSSVVLCSVVSPNQDSIGGANVVRFFYPGLLCAQLIR